MENGKKVCKELKAIRQQIADANGIKYTPNECTHKGDCAGTCPACEAEVEYLEKELNLRRMLGKAVVVAGLGLTVSSCIGGSHIKKGMTKYQAVGDVPAVIVDNLEGDVPAERTVGKVPSIDNDSSDVKQDSCVIIDKKDAKSN